MHEATDAELLDACRAGDESAWRALVERYAALVLSIPRRYGFKKQAAEDVFGDVCVAWVRALDSIRDAQSLPQWLIKTATRATWAAGRKAKRAPTPVGDVPELTGAAPPESFLEALEAEQAVRTALRRLGARCRRLLELLYFTDPAPSYDEAARRLDMPRGSLGPTRRRCLDRMRGFLPPGVSGTREATP